MSAILDFACRPDWLISLNLRQVMYFELASEAGFASTSGAPKFEDDGKANCDNGGDFVACLSRP